MRLFIGFSWVIFSVSTPIYGQCEPPNWFTGQTKVVDNKLESQAKSSLLSDAIRLAEDQTWRFLYDPQKSNPLTTKELLAEGEGSYDQKNIDRAIAQIYNWALKGQKKERSYELICNEYFVSVKIDTKGLTTILRDRNTLSEYLYFMLAGDSHLVREELRWHRFWRKHGLLVPDRQQQISSVDPKAAKLASSGSDIHQSAAKILKSTSGKLNRYYLSLYQARKERQFLNLRNQIRPLILQFDQLNKASDALVLNQTEPARNALLAAANAGNTDSFYLLGLLYLADKSDPSSRREAYKWLTLAQKSGVKGVERHLLSFYIDGDEDEKNYKLAMSYLPSTFNDQDPKPYLQAGTILIKGGYGAEKDALKGIEYLTKAAKMPAPDGAEALGKLYFEGEALPKDLAKSQFWFEHAKTKGSKVANSFLLKIKTALKSNKAQKAQKSTLKQADKAVKSLKVKSTGP